ncbi:hypothetical protein CHARACLAT_008630 [Characodon lateralis]|uniref:Uncharacterized protein n=1 Tax=Characodon lateralis TaxID=208331 RepID=A0ABU7D724_9TELE|nr:hypothetical protein [Characodon lateralis]
MVLTPSHHCTGGLEKGQGEDGKAGDREAGERARERGGERKGRDLKSMNSCMISAGSIKKEKHCKRDVQLSILQCKGRVPFWLLRGGLFPPGHICFQLRSLTLETCLPNTIRIFTVFPSSPLSLSLSLRWV